MSNDKTPNGKLMYVKNDKVDQYGKLSASVVLSDADAAEFNSRFLPALESKRKLEATSRNIPETTLEIRLPCEAVVLDDGSKVNIVQVGCKKSYETKEYKKKDGTVVPSEKKENNPFFVDANGDDLVLPAGTKIGNGSIGNLAFYYNEAFVGADKKTFQPYVSMPLRWVGGKVIELVPYQESGVNSDPRSLYAKK